MDYTHLIIFKYNNAYDVYSSDSLSEAKEYIDNIIMEKHGAFIFTKYPDVIQSIMNEFSFTYRIYDLQWLDNIDLIRSAINFEI
jgi:hypothetical protein